MTEAHNRHVIVFKDFLPCESRRILVAELLQNSSLHAKTELKYRQNLTNQTFEYARDCTEYSSDLFKTQKYSDIEVVDLNLTSLKAVIGWISDHELVLSIFRDKHLRVRPSFVGFAPDSSQSLEAESIMQQFVELHGKGYTGSGIKVAVFDTGLTLQDNVCRLLKRRIDFTESRGLGADNNGHGTAITGIICSTIRSCGSLAPDVELHAVKVFSDRGESFTSWLLEAFNYAIMEKMNIVNLSIGGPDYDDEVFSRKIKQVAAAGTTIVSAIGNGGPVHGTVHTPASMLEVIGVGGLDNIGDMATYSARGMTTGQLPLGTGFIKPDIVTCSMSLPVLKAMNHVGLIYPTNGFSCSTMSGTSFSTPVISAALAVAISSLDQVDRSYINPARLKQCAMGSASRLKKVKAMSQGAGKLNVINLGKCLRETKIEPSIFPPKLDFIDCPYFYPQCLQPLYSGGKPLAFKLVVLNPICKSFYINSEPFLEDQNLLSAQFNFSNPFWPWIGSLELKLWVKEGINKKAAIVENVIVLKVHCIELTYTAIVKIPVRLKVIETPPRSKRLLWDQFHQLAFPRYYAPRDELVDMNLVQREISGLMDWPYDHLFTSYVSFYEKLLQNGYYVEILSERLTTVDAKKFAAILIMDPEREFSIGEMKSLEKMVVEESLGVVIGADWYSKAHLEMMSFFDDETKKWWHPLTAGCNIPSLNKLLQPFNISFGIDHVYSGRIFYGKQSPIQFNSGVSFTLYPEEMKMFYAKLWRQPVPKKHTKQIADVVPFLGLLKSPAFSGRIAAYGDTACVEGNSVTCWGLVKTMVDFATAQFRPDFARDSSK